jgi:hypothetical protein
MGVKIKNVEQIAAQKQTMLTNRMHDDFEFMKLFDEYFVLDFTDDGNSVSVKCKFKSKVPEEYMDRVADHLDGLYEKKLAKGFDFWSSDLKEKTDDELYRILKERCEQLLQRYTRCDSDVCQYIGLLREGFYLITCFDECQYVNLSPGDMESYMKLVEEYYPVRDLEKYRKYIIERFAKCAKENNLAKIEYNSPVCYVELPHIFNKNYDAMELRARRNEECGKVISEIKEAMSRLDM